MLWEIDIQPLAGLPDLESQRIIREARELGLPILRVQAMHGYLIQSSADGSEIESIARNFLSDGVVEQVTVAKVGSPNIATPPSGFELLLHVMRKPGVTDPVAQSALQAMQELGISVDAVRTLRKYWFPALDGAAVQLLSQKLLANDSIEQVLVGPLQLTSIELGASYHFELKTIPLREKSDRELERLSADGQLYLTLPEMQTIQRHFRDLQRDPTDAELETIAQTWSEHCSHKTLAGRIAYQDDQRERLFTNMLKETIFAATSQIRETLGDRDWCVSVFKDNAGVIRFDEDDNVVFKVETHNHPSALEPYGGANTGLGGVIRDPLGTGLGAKPICNTDVFCFAPPNTPPEALPAGVLHPRRIMNGVVEGVRDYGNRMGIPTVNGAIYFDARYAGNPLVYCGNVGILPRNKSEKAPLPGDHIVTIGGRTGRDGIHGATFSSGELTSDSEMASAGAVQIGNAITEKMLMDVLLTARDRNLFNAVTDCGAGGFSSAVGEMGEAIGAEVWLDRAPLKYEGLSYTEIWISEAQERMILAVSPSQWEPFSALCASEGVEATVIGTFAPTGRLRLVYQDHEVANLSMTFLHEGRPPIVRSAVYRPPAIVPFETAKISSDHRSTLLDMLRSWNIASKEWVIRQYDHEVQGGSVIKPLVGVRGDGPSDAAVVRPKLHSRRGIVISCGMNPRFGDFDPYHMAASAIDEALRNAVAVGANPDRIAILDNFCWGYTDRPETLGSLVRAAIACEEVAVAMGTPFISGKDSLNNEFSYFDAQGNKQTISIPSSLLISAIGIVDDVGQVVTMDLKSAGNLLYQVGLTRAEFGGSHLGLVTGVSGGNVPHVDTTRARAIFGGIHQAIQRGLVRACHDLSEGGLAVAVAEMAFAGGLGVQMDLSSVPGMFEGTIPNSERPIVALFSESNSRFVCEVPEVAATKFEQIMADVPFSKLGRVTSTDYVEMSYANQLLLRASLDELREAWQAPLRSF